MPLYRVHMRARNAVAYNRQGRSAPEEFFEIKAADAEEARTRAHRHWASLQPMDDPDTGRPTNYLPEILSLEVSNASSS